MKRIALFLLSALVFNAIGQAVTSYTLDKTEVAKYGNLNGWVLAKGANNISVNIVGASIKVNGKLISNSNIDFNAFLNGAKLTSNTSISFDTLIIKRMSAKPEHNCFDTTLSAVLIDSSACVEVYAHWWGNNKKTLIKAAASAAYGSHPLVLAKHRYPVNGRLNIASNVDFIMNKGAVVYGQTGSASDTISIGFSSSQYLKFDTSVTVLYVNGSVPYINSMSHGAIGDSVTDDYPFIRKIANITNIKKVFRGKHKIGSNLTLYGECHFENGAKLIPDNGDTVKLDSGTIIFSDGDWDDKSNGGVFDYGKATFERRITTETPGNEYSVNNGYPGNIIRVRSSFVNGGTQNYVQMIDTLSELSVIGGAYDNVIRYNCIASTIAGGAHHIIDTGATHSFIGGGAYHKTNGNYNAITGGRLNQTFCNYGTIAGGQSNTVGDSTATNMDSSRSAFVGGGGSNKAYKLFSVIAGGYDNLVSANYSAICGGVTNIASGLNAYIGGGLQNEVRNNYNAISGGRLNKTFGTYSTIAGGQSNLAGDSTVHADTTKSAFVGGGTANKATNAFAVIVGGYSNTVSAKNASICGGESNEASGTYTYIGGGSTNRATSNYSTISGGRYNKTFGTYSVIAGGYSNIAGDSTQASDSSRNTFVGGGNNNIAIGLKSVVCGGATNTASGAYSVCVGGNTNTASGSTSFSMGENSTASGMYSVAMGELLEASGRNSVASGSRSKAQLYSQRAHASGYFAAKGDAQISDLVARKLSVGAQTANLDLNGGTVNSIRVPNNTTWNFNIQVIARNIQTSDQNGAWNFVGAIKCDGDSTTCRLVGTVKKDTLNQPTGWDCVVDADTTLGRLLITQTTTAGVTDSIRWVARIGLVEVAE